MMQRTQELAYKQRYNHPRTVVFSSSKGSSSVEGDVPLTSSGGNGSDPPPNNPGDGKGNNENNDDSDDEEKFELLNLVEVSK